MSQLPKIAQKGPYIVNVEAGQRYSWCTCGLSTSQPFCDGAHRGSGLRSLPFFPENSGPVALCGCKATKTPPYCDGSHGCL